MVCQFSKKTLKMSEFYLAAHSEPELILFVIAIVLLAYGLTRHPLKYTAFLLVYTLVNYSVTFLISGGRYMSCAFPPGKVGSIVKPVFALINGKLKRVSLYSIIKVKVGKQIM